MPTTTFPCLVTRCTRAIASGLFCADHAYMNDSPQALWAVRHLDEHARELRGVYCTGDRWGFLSEVSRR